MADEVLGELTAARAREDDDIVEQIAALTELTERTVRKRLVEVTHGKTLVRNVFADAWPTGADDLAEMHVKQAREAGLFSEIAVLTGLSERVVRTRLEEAHGKGRLDRLFADAWPGEHAHEDDEPQGEDDDDAPLAIGDLTVARAREDDALIERIGRVTELERGTVRRRLRGAHGASRVRNVFEERWPVDAAQLGDLRVKLVRECGLIPEVSAITHQSAETVAAWLAQGDGRMAVRNLFAGVWPSASQEDGDDEPEGDDEPGNDEEERGGVQAARTWLKDAVAGVKKWFAGDDEPDDGEEVEDDAELDPLRRFRLDPEGAWSRPRPLVRVIHHVGMDVPQRLRTPRFQEVLRQLDELGIEMCLADSEDDTPFSLDADSPGIHASVRLRLHLGRRAAPPAPRRISAPPPPPIVVTPAPRHVAPPLQAPREPGYDMALRRLQFLTAVPSMDRQHELEWPDAYVEAALVGLEVPPLEVKHLRMVAASLVKGHHSPAPILGRLVKVELPSDLDALLHRFLHLNRAMPEFAAEVVQWVHEQRGGQPHVAPAPMHVPAHAAPAPPQARAAAPHVAPASSHAPPTTASNVRSLGALDDMFKD